MSKRRHGDVVPFTAIEWNYVKSNMKSDEVSVLKNMLDILSMWESRGGSSTPIVIKLTKLVLQGIHFDYANIDSEDLMSESNARLIYSTVLVRFISYLNEVCQPKAGRLVSVFEATKVVGIPQWIVQMRHNIAHEDMPEITQLRDGVEFCRNWLWDIHWKQPVEVAITVPGIVQSTPVDDIDPKAVDDLKKNLADYATLVFAMQKDKSNTSANAKKLKKCLDGLRGIISDEPHLFVNGVAKKLLINREQMKKSNFQYDCSENGLKAWHVPKKYSEFWKPLIVLLEDLNSFGVLLNQISRQLSEPSVGFFEKSQYAGWTCLFLERVFISEIVLSDYDVKVLIMNLLDGSFYFEKHHFIKLLDLLKNRISPEKKAEYLNLWDIKSSAMDVDEYDDSIQVLSLDSLTPLHKKKKKVEFFEWGIVDVGTSLGLTDNQSDETLDLELKKP